MSKTFYKLSCLATKFLSPRDELKDTTFFALDKKTNEIMECRLLRIETTISRDEKGKTKVQHLLVLNIADKGIVKTTTDTYRFYKTERDIYEKNGICPYVEVSNTEWKAGYLRLLFGNVTTVQTRTAYMSSHVYIYTENFVWNNESLKAESVDCYVDVSKVGIASGYDEDVRLFSIDGKPISNCILYSDYYDENDEYWIGPEDGITKKVYRTEDDCIADNRPPITRFHDSEEENDSDKFVEVVLI